MKKAMLSLLVVVGTLMGTQATAQEFTSFGAGLGGGASFFPSTGSFGYSFSNPYAGVGAAAATQNNTQKAIADRRADQTPTTQNNLGGTVLVVNAKGPVNLRATLENKGNVKIEQPE